MFKKLKQKISEEQSPSKSPLAPDQQGRQRSTSAGNRSRTSSVTEQQDDSLATSDRELLAGMIAEPALLSEYTVFALDRSKRSKQQSDSVNGSLSDNNGNDPISSQRNEPQSFAQKLQMRVPSMESLFRSPIKESLFSSSTKENLLRSGSRDSLNKIDMENPGTAFDPPSDIESEAEDSVGSVEGLNKEQLFNRLHRMDKSLGNYRGKYSELVTAYRTQQRDKEKLQSILSQSQDKALRRIGELREELQMDQQAKKHLQEEFDASLEEKDQHISVLQTQVSLLKKRLQNGQGSSDVPECAASPEPDAERSLQEVDADNGSTPDADGNATSTLNALQVRVKRQENLLQRCKKSIRSHKEQCVNLSSENEALQNQLHERLQELEKMKELHTSEKTKLITQLRDAKNSIEQLEQDKGMMIAEAKRQMHETLELKEEEISQLRLRVKKLNSQCEDLQQQKETFEKAAFEDAEKTVIASQKTEDVLEKLQMEEQIKAIEKASEEERVNLQRELSRVKQEVVDIMKKSCDSRISEIENVHAEALLNKEQEYNEQMRLKEQDFQDQLNAVLKKNEEILNLQQDKEKSLMALEELEQQKKTLECSTAEQLKEMQQEVECYRTRILELESSVAEESKSQDFASLIETERNNHNAEVIAIKEKHKQDLDVLVQEQERIWSEKLALLKEETDAMIIELKQKYQQEYDAQLKERECNFQEHIEQMNEKTLEKLDLKQTELETLSAELSEAINARQEIEQKLLETENDTLKIKQEYDTLIKEEREKHSEEIGSIEREKEILTMGIEKDLKENINNLKLLLDNKECELEELRKEKQNMKEAAEKAEADLKETYTLLESSRHSHEVNVHEKEKANELQLKELQENLKGMTEERNHLKEVTETAETQLKSVQIELDTSKAQVQSLMMEYETQVKDLKVQIEEMSRIASENEHEVRKLKEEHKQIIIDLNNTMCEKEKNILALQEDYKVKHKNQDAKMDKLRQKLKELQESSKKKYSEMETKLKKEIDKKQNELINKEKEYNEKMHEMAQASSTGINHAMAQLELNHKEQIQNTTDKHQRELQETTETWEKKLSQLAEELREKHEEELQEKDQVITEARTELNMKSKEKEDAEKQISYLKELKTQTDVSFSDLQEQLRQSSAQVLHLTQSGNEIKTQLERVEKDCAQLTAEKQMLQQQLDNLKILADEDKSKVDELVSKMRIAEEKYNDLETLHNKVRVDFAKELQDTLVEKENDFKHLLGKQENQLISCCKNAEDLFESLANGLTENHRNQMDRWIVKIANIESYMHKLKEVTFKQRSKMFEQEKQLEQFSKELLSVNKSLNQVTQHMQEKENITSSLKDEIEALNFQNELLKKEGGSQQKVADEKESCITQLKKELSEKTNIVTSLTEVVKERESQVSSLSSLINELKVKHENCVDLTEKENAIAFLTAQQKQSEQELQNQIQELMTNIEILNKEKSAHIDEAAKLQNKLDEWKKKAELKFVQNHNTIKELKEKVETVNKHIVEKDEKLRTLTEEFECHRSNIKETELTRESKELDLISQLEGQTSRILELEEQCLKLMSENKSLMDQIEIKTIQQSEEKKVLVEQIQNVQCVSDNNTKEVQHKVLTLGKEIDALKEELEAKQTKWQLEKAECFQMKDEELKTLEERLTTESANKLSELKKRAEQKIASLKKQLMSQIEEKEQSRKELENQLQSLKINMQKEGQEVQEGLQQEVKNQENKYVLLLEQQKNTEADLTNIRSEVKSKEQRIIELEDIIKDVQQKLSEKELTESEKEQELLKELEAQMLTNNQLVSTHEKALKDLQDEINVKDAEIKTFKEEIDGKFKSLNELQVLFEETHSQESALKIKLEEVEREKLKFRNEITKLQKDMRSLRKEHNQELDLLKKEITEEAEQRIKYEQEDLELKHNSKLKQLMREFNTQMAKKEREVETAVQETIAKAQEVEAELMRSQQIEAVHLHKKIAEKEDDLKRTVKRYEELLEGREEEMTAKVTELQEQLEKLQEELSLKEMHNEEEQNVEEKASPEVFQAQLAQKTSQLNEYKLKEQELKEKVHILEDQVKNFTRGVFYSPIGTPYKEVNNQHAGVSVFGEPTEFEYLRKVMFEYMMGRETKTMAKVITTVLRFPTDQAQQILQREENQPLPRSGMF
ncbi:golgin subfamily A member 4 isoform X2 [Xenopus laevis]|uniref:Golgin subfamily A member 4 isoform X2 n=1 Tax=Xenopus laevis TaxID=8355 RepID=A0A8J1L0K0_XENLA|nr:golgin subfamily A member 4 isoform X2 [Xenopus laevis]